MSDQLNAELISELLRIKSDGNLYHRESQNLEFKESFSFAGLADYFRDFSAMANNKGGHLIFGVKDRPKRELIGLSKKAFEQFDKLDPEIISGHLLERFSGNIVWEHEIYSIGIMNFGVFYIHEAIQKPIICKKDDGKDMVLKNGEIYFRYGGRTQKIQYAELENLINKRIESNNRSWIDLFSKISKAGPQNAAVLDITNGSIEKGNNQILMIDESLVKQLSFIREGEFEEKKGAKTLKLVGNVSPIDRIEVIQKIKENLLKEYPFSASDFKVELKKRLPAVKEPQIYKAIKNADIRGNKDYSAYNFRNKTHEDVFLKDGTIPSGTPCLFNQKAIDFIIQTLLNDLSKQP